MVKILKKIFVFLMVLLAAVIAGVGLVNEVKPGTISYIDMVHWFGVNHPQTKDLWASYEV